MSDLTVITNGVARDVVEAHELTLLERAEFDYVDWESVDAGDEAPQFFRYRGELYDLGEGFERVRTATAPGELRAALEALAAWDGMRSDTFFSGLLIRWPREAGRLDFERVIVGRFYC